MECNGVSVVGVNPNSNVFLKVNLIIIRNRRKTLVNASYDAEIVP